jgi:hypothetical protein
VPEKVWYCKQKGYKPWLKPKKKDTRTHEEGSHTIWYSEQQLLKVGVFSGHPNTNSPWHPGMTRMMQGHALPI